MVKPRLPPNKMTALSVAASNANNHGRKFAMRVAAVAINGYPEEYH
jgi:hypothetical protein